MRLFDINGSPIGCFQECGDDWTNVQLGAEELTYRDFQDTIVLSNSPVMNIAGVFRLSNSNSNSNWQQWGYVCAVVADGTVKVKLAIVNENEAILSQIAFHATLASPLPRRIIFKIFIRTL